MKSPEKAVLNHLQELFNNIPREFFKVMFHGFVPHYNLTPDFDWMFKNRDTVTFNTAIMYYHMLGGACDMAYTLGYLARFNLSSWKVDIACV